MKPGKKSLIALGLSLSMVASVAAPAYAADLQTDGNPVVETFMERQVDETQLSPWLITEAVTDGVSGERYTYLEVFNNSDQELDFSEYVLFYDYPAGGGYVFSKNGTVSYTNGKAYTKRAYLSAEDNTELTSIKVGSGETLVLWYNDKLTTTSLTEFKNYYSLGDDVNIVRINHSGIHSSQKRGYRIGKDSDTIITEAYSDEYGNMIPNGDNKDAYQFTYPASGKKCEQMSIAAATPGTVIEGQVPSTRVTVKETPIVIGNVSATGDGDMVVSAEIPYEGTAGAMAVNLTYNQSAGEGEDTVTSGNNTVVMLPAGDGKTFTATIPADRIFGSRAEYSITAGYGGSNKAVSEKAALTLNRKQASTENAAPLIITETAPTSAEDGVERYDFFEVYNQSNETINLGYWKIFYYYEYPEKTASQSGKIWQLSDFTQTIAPGKTKVFWLNNKGLAVSDFNNFYGTDLVEGEDIVEVNYSGLHATDARWFRIGTTEENAFTLAAFNEEPWQITTSGNSLHYAAPNDDTGVNRSIPVVMSKSTPGTVAGWQISDAQVEFSGYPDYPANDGQKPTLKVCPESGFNIPEFINEGEEIQVMYDVDLLSGAVGSDRLDAFKNGIDENNPTNHPGGNESLKTRPYLIGTEILYKLDNDTEWTSVKERKQWRLGHYLMKIPSDILFGHSSITYKVRACSLYDYNETSEVTVKINRLNDTKGSVRLNVQDGSVISGNTTITANDGADNANTVISVDGTTQNQKKVFENGAYFSLKTNGVDSYFKDGITAPYGDNSRELITILYNWCEATDSKVIKIDNKYFTYHPETDSYDVTLTIWAGSSGTPFEEIYDCVLGENHEDFNVSALQMRLTNGKSYLPVKIEPDNVKTNTSTDLSAVHTIGDSAGMVTHLDATFSIPAADAEAVGITLDTTALTDGEHTIAATAGEKTSIAKVIVDNTEPEININIVQDAVLYDQILLEEGSIASDANGIRDVVVSLDDSIVALPAVIHPEDLEEGTHTIKAVVTDIAGNVADKEIQFMTENTTPEVSDVNHDGIADKEATLTVNLGNETGDVTFYEGKSLTEENHGVVRGESGESKNGSVPYQLFSVNAGDIEKTDSISVKWQGTASNVNASHPLTMFVRNTETNTWKAVAEADKDGNIQAVFEAGEYVEAGKATILVQTLAKGDQPAVKANRKTAEAAAGESTQQDWDGTSRPENYDFAMAWETDTQYYAESFPYHYDNMNQWIADHAEDWKIKYVFHTGDIVDDCDMESEWINADRSMKILDDAGVPYGVLGGNHDVFAGAENYENYWKYFGADRFEGRDYYGGTYKNNLGHYDLISEGGQDFIILYMSWDIYTNELNWMNEVLQKYSDRKAILAFHRYIGVGEGDQKLDYTGKLIQNEVVAKNKNVIAVLNGHYHGASLQTDAFDDDGDGFKERTVYQICTDYQSDAEGGAEYLKLLYFDFTNNKIYVNSYSPYLDDYNYYDSAKMDSYAEGARATNQDIAELDVDFDTNEKTLTTTSICADVRTKTKIGTVKDAAETVKYIWSGLDADTEYGWYAEVKNNRNGVTYTDVKTFKTEQKAGVYTVTATAGQGGYISNAGETEVAEGGKLTYMVSAKEGYRISKVLVDGVAVQLTGNQYTIDHVDRNHTIEVEFEAVNNGNTEAEMAETLEAAKAAQEAAERKLSAAEAMLKEAKECNEETRTLRKETFKAQKVTITSVKSRKKKTAEITWEKIDGAEGYVIEYALKASFKGAKTVTVTKGTAVSRTLKKLKSRKAYYVRVKAYQTVDGEKIYTGTGAKKKVRIK